MMGIPDEGPRPSTRSDGLKLTKAPRTRIEDISAIGERLSEEQLRLVVGGLPTCGGGPYLSTAYAEGAGYDTVCG